MSFKNKKFQIGILVFLSLPISQMVFAQNTIANSPGLGNPPMISNAIQSGIGTTIILVFIVLAILLWGFRLIGNLMVKKVPVIQIEQTPDAKSQNTSDEEVSAAIAMALHLYSSQIHDQENPVITMIKVSRTYSPWSSKIYGLRKSPR